MKGKEIKRVKYSKRFLRSSGKLQERVIHQAEEKEIVFKKDAFHPTLKTHKLHGEEKETWAFWINYKYRIKFIFLSDNEVLFLDIGTHNIYK